MSIRLKSIFCLFSSWQFFQSLASLIPNAHFVPATTTIYSSLRALTQFPLALCLHCFFYPGFFSSKSIKIPFIFRINLVALLLCYLSREINMEIISPTSVFLWHSVLFLEYPSVTTQHSFLFFYIIPLVFKD